MDLNDLNVRINKAGVEPSEINAAAVALLNTGKVTLFDLMPLLTPLRALSGALASIQAWSNDAKTAAAAKTDSGLPPGMTVVDVGDVGSGVGTGSIPVSQMTPANVNYYTQKAGLAAKWAQIFSGTVAELNAAIGANAGTVATAGQDPIVRDRATGAVLGDLSTFG